MAQDLMISQMVEIFGQSELECVDKFVSCRHGLTGKLSNQSWAIKRSRPQRIGLQKVCLVS